MPPPDSALWGYSARRQGEGPCRLTPGPSAPPQSGRRRTCARFCEVASSVRARPFPHLPQAGGNVGVAAVWPCWRTSTWSAENPTKMPKSVASGRAWQA